MKAFMTLIQREYWENRGSFAITPVAIGGFFIVVLIFALFGSQAWINDGDHTMTGIRISGVEVSGFDFFAGMTKEFAQVPLAERVRAWTIAFFGLSGMFKLVMVFVSTFYLLGALYDDRRDRSILFWKSLPVSDLTTVSSKVATVFLLIPLFYITAMLLTFLFIMIIGSIVALISGGSVWASIWEPAPFLSITLKIFYGHLIQTLWAAPLLGWLLFVSSWTKRKPILMATIPIGVLAFLEFYYNRTAHLITAITERATGWVLPIDIETGRHFGSGVTLDQEWNMYEHTTSLLGLAGMWWGLIIAALFFAASVFVRRYRDESL